MPNLIEQLLSDIQERTLSPAQARAKLEQLGGSTENRALLLSAISQVELQLASEAESKPVQAQTSILTLLPDGWLRDYVSFQHISEAPDSFHLFSALAMLSHIVGRKLWYRGAIGGMIYAPMSVFLVSPAGQARRSSAINAVVEVGRAAETKVIQDAMTPEGLLHWLRENPHAMIVGDEAAALLSKSSYQEIMPQVLCRLLDCPPSYEKTLKTEEFHIEMPTVNILMGCAPEWILTSMPKSALGGGLFSRMIVVRETRVKRLIPRPSKELDEVAITSGVRGLSEKLVDITSRPGGMMDYDDRAGKLFDDFYAKNDAASQDVDERMAVYLSRKPTHVHRMCMAMLVSRGGGSLKVDETTLSIVLAILAAIENGMVVAYSMSGLEQHGQLQQRILNRIDKGGGQVKHSDLLRYLSCTADALSEATVSLMEGGVIDCKPVKMRGHLTKLYTRAARRREKDED